MHTAIGSDEKTQDGSGFLPVFSIIGFGLVMLAASFTMIEAGKQAGQFLGI